jgi:hypothetical protein
MIEEGRLQAYKLREHGPWHILMDSVRKLECELLTKAGVKESNAS